MIRYADDFKMYENELIFGESRKVKILVQECFRNYNPLCKQKMCLEEWIRTQNVFKRVDFCHMNCDYKICIHLEYSIKCNNIVVLTGLNYAVI